VLAEPGGELDESLGGAPAAGAQAGSFAAGAKLIAAGDIEGGLRVIAEYTGGPGAWEKRAEHRKLISRDNARTLLGQMNERRKPYSRAAAEQIKAPTLLLGGAQSQPNFGKIIGALMTAIPDIRSAVLQRATHSLNEDNPSDFNAAVLEFLQGR
jgi:pimeloyl-ACP methyl ester carboxylesterase